MEGKVRIGFLGCGIVGGGAARILLEHAAQIEQRAGVPLEIGRVAVRSLSKPREVTLAPDRWWSR
jgi:homoserine dehydrogenase